MTFVRTLSLIAVLALAIGCSGDGEADQAQNQTSDAGTKTHGAIDAAQEVVAKTEARQLEEGAEVTVSGKLGCGHCDYHVGKSCNAAIQTPKGSIFILDVAEESEWFQKRYDGARLEVTGNVRHRGADVMLEAKSITEL